MTENQKPLTTVRAINEACWLAAVNSRGRTVYAETATDNRVKIFKARTVKGVLQVRTGSGWRTASRVWTGY
jgi:hypothetical protein